MKVFLYSLLAIWVVLVTTECPTLSAEKEGRQVTMKRLLPQKVEDYIADGKDEFYDRNSSFRYMNGAAELYRSYAFKLLVVRKYVKTNQPPILVEFFDMDSPAEAFGIFSYETGEEDVKIGQGSDYGGGLLRFWKGKYFANVFAERETPTTKKDILVIGEAIARNINQGGLKPKLIQFLPEEDLSERTLRYFHLHLVLNHHYFLSHQNILRLGNRTNGILATYLPQQTKEKIFLLLVQYSTKNLAESAFQSFVKAYMPESSASRTIKTENGKWTSAKIHQQYILVVFDASTVEKAEQLIQMVVKKLSVK
ncbi:MAG: hypothetical protein FJ110_07315 [Deltaproteobacteria bacterium]|nr:hypothetical protein [Deltaproteobacteria bacterium]